MAEKDYMLDTNTVSYIIKGDPPIIRERLRNVPIENIYISAITEAELLRGIAKMPNAKQLHTAVHEFLIRVSSLPWDSEAASAYAQLRTACEKEGKPLGNMDMLIAAHAIAVNATLVTNDKAFYNVKHLIKLDDWTRSGEH